MEVPGTRKTTSKGRTLLSLNSMSYTIKDSGKRKKYKSGMNRDTTQGKPILPLLVAEDVPFEESMLYRWAMHATTGIEKYGRRNWELAKTDEELQHFVDAAARHLFKWLYNVEDGEDHAAAAMWNINAVETLRWRKNVLHRRQKNRR